MNQAITTSIAERIADLGGIPSERICSDPPPGKATFDDLLRVQRETGRLYELLDGTLVEKAMGWQESMLAGVLLQWLNNFLDHTNAGVATGADGLTRLFNGTVRGPDVAFVSWDRLPEGRLPEDPIPNLVPDFVIEVLSVSNTRGEMARKRREYFNAGVRLVWMVDPRARTIAVFTSSEDFVVVDDGGTLSGGDVLPDWEFETGSLFAKLDRQPPADA